MQLAPHEPDFAGGRVVADEQLALADDPAAEARAERDAEQILVLFRAAGRLQFLVDVGEEAGDGLAVGEQVAVVVDEHGDLELLFEHRSQGHAAAKAGQIAQIADDARRIIGRTGKGEADGHGRLGQRAANLREALDDSGQTALQIVGLLRAT